MSEKNTRILCVGFTMNHTTDVYRTYNPEINIVLSQYVRWADWVHVSTRN